MAFQNLSENIILVDLAGEPQMRDELKTITDMVLVFCGVAPFTRSTFSVTGLDGIFELAEDRTTAAAVLQCAGQPGNTQ